MATPRLAQATGWGRLPRVAAGLEAIEKHHPDDPHFYLLALGVEPELQGRSIGTQLMRPVLERCDRERIPAYLESSKQRNVPLYERNGFRVQRTVDLPNGGPRVWLMWREPQ
jgi:ribosomal protein S18 acetylase RimI-like enzyme